MTATEQFKLTNHSKSVYKLFEDPMICKMSFVFCYKISLYAPDITNLSSINHVHVFTNHKNIVISILTVEFIVCFGEKTV